MNQQGLASYCQECGSCVASLDTCDQSCQTVPSMREDDLFNLIVDEVVRNIQGELPRSEPATDANGYPTIPLGVSNRHMHLSRETLEILFGPGAQLESYRDLFQPGEFAAKQTVTIVGSKMRAIQNVRILGPLRNYDQVEISLTDAISIGVKAPVHDSGNLEGAAPLTLVGPEGSVFLRNAAIIASRHVHMTNADAAVFGIKDGDRIKVRIPGIKGTVFENVLVRTNDSWKMQLHLDTDEANAANVRCNTHVEFYGKM